jgi:hypothetical protein
MVNFPQERAGKNWVKFTFAAKVKKTQRIFATHIRLE